MRRGFGLHFGNHGLSRAIPFVRFRTMITSQPLEHLYLHFPFCNGRCGYCAFLSGPPPTQPLAYVQQLCQEAATRGVRLAPLRTLYCGGGTPGLMGSAGFRALREAHLFTLATEYEWTVELHPATVTPELLQTLAACGVNRISIGVQSLDDAVLQHCNRRHTAAQALQAIETARAYIPDTGIDLIAGLPGVTPAKWLETVRRCAHLELPHLSVYALSIDEGSHWHRQGRAAPDPEQVCDAVADAAEVLGLAGYDRYETSNYARPGARCQHNLNTWHGGDYVGLGRGAASRIGRVRQDGLGAEETLSEMDDALERALTGLRLDEGFNPMRCRVQYPILAPLMSAWEELLAEFRKNGLLNERNAPTTRGYEVLDAMERALLEAAL